jgi:hypothetical protein
MSDDAGNLVGTAQITPGAEHPQPVSQVRS